MATVNQVNGYTIVEIGGIVYKIDANGTRTALSLPDNSAPLLTYPQGFAVRDVGNLRFCGNQVGYINDSTCRLLFAPTASLSYVTSCLGNTTTDCLGTHVSSGIADSAFLGGIFYCSQNWDEAGQETNFYDLDNNAIILDQGATHGGFQSYTCAINSTYFYYAMELPTSDDPTTVGAVITYYKYCCIGAKNLDGSIPTIDGAIPNSSNFISIGPKVVNYTVTNGGSPVYQNQNTVFTGMFATSAAVYISDPFNSRIVVCDPNTLTITSTLTAEHFANAGQLTVDGSGNIWFISGVNYSSFGSGLPVTGTVTKLNASGTVLGTLSGVTTPTALYLSATGNIWVAERSTKQITIFNTSTFSQTGTMGVEGGMLARDGVIDGPMAFLGTITGMGDAEDGSVYVSFTLPNIGDFLYKYDSDGNVVNRFYGLSFIEPPSFDEGGTLAYTHNMVYSVDLTQDAGQQATPLATTMNEVKYPDDLRQWIGGTGKSMVRNIHGKKFIIYQPENSEISMWFEIIDGQHIQRPSMVFVSGTFSTTEAYLSQNPDASFLINRFGAPAQINPDDPTNLYYGRSGPCMWVDSNGDGLITSDEWVPLFTLTPPDGGDYQQFWWVNDFWIDSNGDIWRLQDTNWWSGTIVQHIPCTGLDVYNNPIYDVAKMTVYETPTPFAYPSGLEQITIHQFRYFPETDTAFAIGFIAPMLWTQYLFNYFTTNSGSQGNVTGYAPTQLEIQCFATQGGTTNTETSNFSYTGPGTYTNENTTVVITDAGDGNVTYTVTWTLANTTYSGWATNFSVTPFSQYTFDGFSIGDTVVRYDNWSTNQQISWQSTLPYQPAGDNAGGYVAPQTFDVVGNLFMVGMGGWQNVGNEVIPETASIIRVYSAITGLFIEQITVNGVCNTTEGWIDNINGTNIFAIDHNNYLIGCQEEIGQKSLFYQISVTYG